MTTLPIESGRSLAELTTFRLGGPARHFVVAPDTETLLSALEWAEAHGEPVLLLGGGSNILVSDEGFAGLVIHNTGSGWTASQDGDHVVVRAKSGTPFDALVAWSVEEGLAGLEALSGIPGSIGATPIQNVGAYGQEIQDTLLEVVAYDRRLRQTVCFAQAECGFRYRHSRFKGDPERKHLITEVAFRLHRSRTAEVRYLELQRALGSDRASLADIRRCVLKQRADKAMVVHPNDPDTRSAGSFFTNPIIDERHFITMSQRCAEHVPPLVMPSWATPPAGFKVSAAWLIERSGFTKGYEKAGAAISSKHALALVNRGCRATDVVDLANEIIAAVRSTWGITLEVEPELVGF